MDDRRKYSDMSSAVSEDRFRQVFFTHLQADGYSEAEAYQLIFRTPDPFQSAASDKEGLELLEASTKRYQAQLAYSWFLEGLSHKLEPDASLLQPPAKPVTFIVIPGIFGELTPELPFQSVVDNKQSHFYKKWQTALEQVADKVYNLVELSEVPCQLSDVVKIGSLDQGERSFANVITLRAPKRIAGDAGKPGIQRRGHAEAPGKGL